MRRAGLLAALSLAVSACGGDEGGVFDSDFRFLEPQNMDLERAGDVNFSIRMPRHGELEDGTLSIRLDGEPVPDSKFRVRDRDIVGTLSGVAKGEHELAAEARFRVTKGPGDFKVVDAAASFGALANPEKCDFLNQAECILPYPSARFLKPVSDTPTGFQLTFTKAAMPVNQSKLAAGQSVEQARLSPDPYKVLDGFSPTVQVLMHFRGAGVDLGASDAPIVTEARNRKTDLRSLERDSPTVLINADTGERVLHWVELDARTNDPDRQVMFLRPGESLQPGERYIVAVRDLVDVEGDPVPPETAFKVFRDDLPTDIQPVAERRDEMEAIFGRLENAGVAREDLILAFDFVVQSREGLTGQMKTMRDDTFQESTFQNLGFTVNNVTENDCSQQGTFTWREVTGTYEVPLYLTKDPETKPSEISFLRTDPQGVPQAQGTTNPPFTIAIPCAVLEDTAEVVRPLLLGHGLFGTGRGFVRQLAGLPTLSQIELIVGGTNWRGLSSPDLNEPSAAESFIVSGIFGGGGSAVGNFDDFAALPDRLRQGQLNTLVLARMMNQGVFNSDPAFQTPQGEGVFPGPSEQMYYFGASLGGIMGSMFAALTPDVDKLNVDVPGTNFSLLLQRATPFNAFESFLKQIVKDSMVQAISLSVIHELWVRGESAGYLTDLREEVSGTNADKDILITPAWLDPQVTNQAAKVVARSIDVPNLAPGSFLMGMPQIPDRQGPLSSAFVVYDTGIYDRNDPDEEPFVPPIVNIQADQENGCSPHPRRGLIPASVDQLDNWFQPGGKIENFCTGACDAGVPKEIPSGKSQPCDPATF